MNLSHKIEQSKKFIRKSFKIYKKKVAVAWTGGKDSTMLLHIIKSCFNNTIPFPVMFNDSTMEFEEIYQFVEMISNKWNLNLLVVEHLKTDLKEFYVTHNLKEKEKFSRKMKINALNHALKQYNLSGYLVAIRSDEHPARSKEKYFSHRKDHIRIHPILRFTERDIWEYIKKFKVPYVSLYDEGYRSLGEKPFTEPAKDKMGERSGREIDKEIIMKKLRKLGYW